MTQGRGTFTHRFHTYELMPHEAAAKVIAESEKEKKEEAPRAKPLQDTAWGPRGSARS
jgi:hypothetical protein